MRAELSQLTLLARLFGKDVASLVALGLFLAGITAVAGGVA